MDNEILKKALESELSDQYRELMDIDIPEYQFSDDFLEKMEELTGIPCESRQPTTTTEPISGRLAQSAISMRTDVWIPSM